MNRKRILTLILAIALALTLAFAITSCNEEAAECTHVDAERDGVCDKCGKPSGVTPCEHTDLNKDKKCDACGADYTATCTDHVSADADAKCDYCGADIVCTECVDSNSDGACDKCGKAVEAAATGSVELVKDGKVKFQFVIANEYKANSTVVQEVDKLINTIKSKKATAERVADTAATEKEIEILIGAPISRGEEYKLDGHTLGYNGYSISVVNGKALVLGGSVEALIDAIKALEKDVLQITSKVKKLPDCTLDEKNSILEMPDKYTIETVTVAGNDLGDYVIAVDESLFFLGADKQPINVAEAVQDLLYKQIGIWLPIVKIDSEYDKAFVLNIVDPREASKAGFDVQIKGGNINIECGFPNKLNEAVMGFVRSEITNKKQPTVTLNENYATSINLRDIKYSETFTLDGQIVGGAVGNGENDDFMEIRGVHLYANRWGHTVNAVQGAHYYIGFEFAAGHYVIPVKTDVNWTGAKFTIDDTVVPVEYYPHEKSTTKPGYCRVCGKPEVEWESTHCTDVKGTTGWHAIALFDVQSDFATETVTSKFTTLSKDATNIGWEPGYDVLIKLWNSDVKHFIRFGINENKGTAQQEIILVHANGDIDETTPLHWEYEQITKAEMKRIDDYPITLTGGDFTTKANLGPNKYYSYGRNVYIKRSNTTFRDFTHYMDENKTHGNLDRTIERCPYLGFAHVNFTHNVTIKNGLITHHTPRYDKDTGAALGTYETSSDSSNATKWIGIRQTNFFNEDGSVSYKGLFDSDFSKNFYFEDCIMTSMDAHQGLYNATIINSTFEHINFIGEGDIYLENVTLYADANRSAINLREDYGSTWDGTVTIKGMDVRYSKTDKDNPLSLFKASYNDWWFGFNTYLPHTVDITDLKLTKYTQTTDSEGNRTETVVGINLDPMYYCSSKFLRENNKDISKLEADGGAAKYNAYKGTDLIKLTDCGSLQLIVPETPQFKFVKIYIDGELVRF